VSEGPAKGGNIGGKEKEGKQGRRTKGCLGGDDEIFSPKTFVKIEVTKTDRQGGSESFWGERRGRDAGGKKRIVERKEGKRTGRISRFNSV